MLVMLFMVSVWLFFTALKENNVGGCVVTAAAMGLFGWLCWMSIQ
jgi:hypothetical protein